MVVLERKTVAITTSSIATEIESATESVTKTGMLTNAVTMRTMTVPEEKIFVVNISKEIFGASIAKEIAAKVPAKAAAKGIQRVPKIGAVTIDGRKEQLAIIAKAPRKALQKILMTGVATIAATMEHEAKDSTKGMQRVPMIAVVEIITTIEAIVIAEASHAGLMTAVVTNARITELASVTQEIRAARQEIYANRQGTLGRQSRRQQGRRVHTRAIWLT